jgi:hypothetical protein
VNQWEVEEIDYYCHLCDSMMELTECESPYCTGYRCLGCDAGCDLYTRAHGECATALAITTPYAELLREYETRVYYRRPVRTVHLPNLPGDQE